jgi:4-amino-4-deoxy-L-arabinose transferase-like glycosyltransferase
MRRGSALAVVAAWTIFLWIVFLLFQYRGQIQSSPVPRYLLGLAASAAVLLVAAGVGAVITGRAPRSASDTIPQTAVGLAALGIAALLLGSAGLIRPYIFWMLLAAGAVLARRNLRLVLRSLRDVTIDGDHRAVWVPFLALAIFAMGVGLVAALAPLTANDALVYHLNIPKIYTANHGLTRLPFNVYANMPHYGEMLYTIVFSLAGEAGAKIFHLLMLLAATAAVYVLASRFVDRRIAVVAGTLFIVQPLVLDHRIVCNVDVMLAYFYLSAAILLLDRDAGRRALRSILPVALLAGFMLGIKYTALIPCATLLLLPALTGQWAWRRTALGIAVAVLVFAPWLVKNAAYVGNPVYPLMEGSFDGANWDRVQSSELISWQRSMGMGRGIIDYLMLPLRISTMGKPGLNYARFDGILNPVFLILLPMALFRRTRETMTILLMFAAGFVFWALTSQQMRFLIPTMALAAAPAGAGLANARAWIGRRKFAILLVLLLLIQISSLLVPDQYGRPVLSGILGDRLAAAAGLESGKDFLGRNVQSYGLFEQMNENIPRGEPVFLVWENRGYYLDRPYFADSFFEASTLMRMVADCDGPEDLKHRISAMGYRYVVVNEMLGDFFSRAYPPRDTALLKTFISDYLAPVRSVNRLTLYTLKD